MISVGWFGVCLCGHFVVGPVVHPVAVPQVAVPVPARQVIPLHVHRQAVAHQASAVHQAASVLPVAGTHYKRKTRSLKGSGATTI